MSTLNYRNIATQASKTRDINRERGNIQGLKFERQKVRTAYFRQEDGVLPAEEDYWPFLILDNFYGVLVSASVLFSAGTNFSFTIYINGIEKTTLTQATPEIVTKQGAYIHDPEDPIIYEDNHGIDILMNSYDIGMKEFQIMLRFLEL